jgi:hypothetical protein
MRAAYVWNARAPHPDLAGVEVVRATTMKAVREALEEGRDCALGAGHECRAERFREALGLLGRGRQ